MSKKVIDWVSIEETYVNTELSARVIGEAYGVSHTAILKKSKKLGWKRLKASTEVSKKVTTTVTKDVELHMGEVTSDEDVIANLKNELDGVFANMFFDVVMSEMKKKYYTYDYFSLFIASEYFQKMMNVRSYIPERGTEISEKGQSYVSGELNVYISMANNFIKVTKDLGLSPISRGRAVMRIVEESKTQGVFSFAAESGDDIDV